MSSISKIICLTEESVETLYLLGRQDLISGVSSFVKRPVEAQTHPKISLFTSSKIDKIIELNADIILGFSDIQQDIAKELIGKGEDVWIANHRSLKGILNYIERLGFLIGEHERTILLIKELQSKMGKIKERVAKIKIRPKVYFEEWDDPMIGNIQWVSELIELCGGIDINKDISQGSLAKERFVDSSKIIDQNPDIIFACWCGKKARLEQIKERKGFDEVEAVKNNDVYELEPEIFLQPGPAPIIDGIDILMEYFEKWSQKVS